MLTDAWHEVEKYSALIMRNKTQIKQENLEITHPVKDNVEVITE